VLEFAFWIMIALLIWIAWASFKGPQSK